MEGAERRHTHTHARTHARTHTHTPHTHPFPFFHVMIDLDVCVCVCVCVCVRVCVCLCTSVSCFKYSQVIVDDTSAGVVVGGSYFLVPLTCVQLSSVYCVVKMCTQHTA